MRIPEPTPAEQEKADIAYQLQMHQEETLFWQQFYTHLMGAAKVIGRLKLNMTYEPKRTDSGEKIVK